MPLISQSLAVQKLKYKHYKQYLDGWFRIYDEIQRKSLITAYPPGSKRILRMTDYEYQQQEIKWQNKLRSNNIKYYLDVNGQLIDCIKYHLPQSFTSVMCIYQW